jgi:predicted O-methyltransferase YrrM
MSRLTATLSDRLTVLRHLLTKRDWVTPVSHLTANSRFGVEIADLRSTLDPLFWWHDDRLPHDLIARLQAHDYTRSRDGIPPWNSEPEVSLFLAKWLLLRRATRVLELGCFTGFTSAHLAAALSALADPPTPTSLTCVDTSTTYLDLARSNLSDLLPGTPTSLTFLQGFSTAPETTAQLPGPYDLIFLDTSHAELATEAELAHYLPLLAPGGTIALHDAIRWPGVRRPVGRASQNTPTLTFATSAGNGLALLIPDP